MSFMSFPFLSISFQLALHFNQFNPAPLHHFVHSRIHPTHSLTHSLTLSITHTFTSSPHFFHIANVWPFPFRHSFFDWFHFSSCHFIRSFIHFMSFHVMSFHFTHSFFPPFIISSHLISHFISFINTFIRSLTQAASHSFTSHHLFKDSSTLYIQIIHSMPFHSFRFLRFHAISFHVIPFLLSVGQSVSVYLSVCLPSVSHSFVHSFFLRSFRSLNHPSIHWFIVHSITHSLSFIHHVFPAPVHQWY